MAHFGAGWEGLAEEQEVGEKRRENLPSCPAGWFFWQFPQDWRPNTHTCERIKDIDSSLTDWINLSMKKYDPAVGA